MPDLRKIGALAIKFANGELEITRQSVNALVNGDPAEIQTLQNLMHEKLCDFKANVDDEIFDNLPSKLRPLYPSELSCK